MFYLFKFSFYLIYYFRLKISSSEGEGLFFGFHIDVKVVSLDRSPAIFTSICSMPFNFNLCSEWILGRAGQGVLLFYPDSTGGYSVRFPALVGGCRISAGVNCEFIRRQVS